MMSKCEVKNIYLSFYLVQIMNQCGTVLHGKMCKTCVLHEDQQAYFRSILIHTLGKFI